MTEHRPVLSEADLAAEDSHDKPRPGGPGAPLVAAPAEALDPETRLPDATAGTGADDVEFAPGDDVVPGEDR